MLEVPLDRTSQVPLHRQLSGHLRRLILSGALPPGERLPSYRQMAQGLSVSRSTVEEAYCELEAEGLLCLSPRRGVFVAPLSRSSPQRRGCEEVLDLGSDEPMGELVPRHPMGRAVRWALGDQAPSDGDVAGLWGLRASLSRYSARRGIASREGDVVVTSGGREGLSLCLWALKEAGVRRLWVERLTYPYAFVQAGLLGLQVVPFARVEDLAGAGVEDGVYLVPSFHNPTGRTMKAPERRAVLEMSHRQGFKVLEDDTYGELRYGPESVPALKAMEGSGQVLYVGSLSKGLFLPMKLGYLVCPGWAAEAVLRVKEPLFGPAPLLSQRIALGLMDSWEVEPILEANRGAVRCRMEALCSPLGIQMPEGGIFAWLDLPVDGDEFAREALRLGLRVSPGSRFSPRGERVMGVRLSVLSAPPEELRRAAGELRGLVERLS
ncbi:PLP-dependent aminotransferase family protein [Thermanaerovibrio acidaminovorans]|uniref:aminotransferase-like domain-containing protein n=1 Tax=Thermanaerovibrio acidaminovorans TaxID=81462 RepID=UPI00248FBCA1|nr:PLP-dependent aminotransferase family protein [Thermanaerovibrio acidaminovorans]